MTLGEQSYAGGVYTEVFGAVNSESFGCRGVLVSGVGLYLNSFHY